MAEEREDTLTLPREPKEFRTMLQVHIATGEVLENKLPWWLRREEAS